MRVSHLLFHAKSLQLTAYAPRADLYRLRPDNTVEILPVNLTEAMKGALTDANPRLQPRDRLRVVKRDEVGDMPTVKIDGPVRKPGSYPCTTGMKLSDLLHQVGGLLADADPVVQLSREVNGKLTNATFAVTVAGDKLTLAVDPFLQAKDLVNVMYNPGYRDPMAGFVLEGAVSRPGSYPLYREVGKQPKTFYEALSQVTLSSDAYPAGITIFRQQNLIGNARQQSELTRYMRELDQRSGIETMSLPDAPGASETATAQSVQNLSQSLGRVIASESGDALTMVIPPRSMKQQAFGLSLAVDAELVLRTKGRKGDLALAPGDVIIVPTRPETVTVLGGVINNGAIRYQTGKSVTYYLNEAGGVASDGEKATAVVLRMNGQLVPARLVKDVNPGDVIIVPTKYITNTIKTKGPFERAIKTLAEMALIALPFAK
jgi:protein involved in polysaccharide export with SLBB domain